MWEDGKITLEKYFLRNKKKRITSSRCHRDNASQGNSVSCIQMTVVFSLLMNTDNKGCSCAGFKVIYVVTAVAYGGFGLTRPKTLD